MEKYFKDTPLTTPREIARVLSKIIDKNLKSLYYHIKFGTDPYIPKNSNPYDLSNLSDTERSL